MKKVLAVLIVVLMLAVTACGQETKQTDDIHPTGNDAAQIQAEEQAEAMVPATEGTVVLETTRADGTKVTEQWEGGKNGVLVWSKSEYADGSSVEEYYYPSGNISKCIMHNADGSYAEFHHADNGSYDAQTQFRTPGTTTYNKLVSADGKVDEYYFDIRLEEDGSWWMHTEKEDGTTFDTHYNADGVITGQNMDNPVTGEKLCQEFYEDGSLKYTLQEMEGYKIEIKYDEEGYCIFYFFQDPVNTREATIDENGTLIKFTINGESQNISYWAKEINTRG